MTKFQRISDKCSIIITKEFGYAVVGVFLGIVSSLADFGIGLFRGTNILSLSGIFGLLFSFFALFVASDYIIERDISGKMLIFCSGGILVSLGIFGRPGFFEMTQPSFLIRLVSFLPLFSTLFLMVSGGKFLKKI